jgi:hypothetical protein
MAGNRSDAGLIDVLDRVLDKGIVIDAHVRVALVGVELVAVEARVVVASIETYLRHAEALSFTSLAARPAPDDVAAATALPPVATPPLIAEPVSPEEPLLAPPGRVEDPSSDARAITPPAAEP